MLLYHWIVHSEIGGAWGRARIEEQTRARPTNGLDYSSPPRHQLKKEPVIRTS